MELTPVQRLVTFVIVAAVLAGLGAYLFLPKSSSGAAAADRPGHHPVPASSPGSPPAGQPAPPSPPAPAPASSSSPAQSAQAFNIYNWLPFTPSELASAARVVTTFAADYGTFSYQQSTSSYLAPMKPLMSSQLAALIGRAYSAPGVAAQRVAGKQVSAGTAVITSLRAFGPGSLTFVVTLTERTNGVKGRDQQSTGYAITATGSGSSWQVSNIQFASAGNQ
ncbi:MAG TPA: hypothetical protein VFQ44_24965 [Streptosporangiaceae bacterium]|nr:hypothetical protein [Streptosporangiaceae bacterium]